MATIITSGRSPRVSFSIDEKTNERQMLLAELYGQKEPSAELQRSAYEKGIELMLTEASSRVDGEAAKQQIDLIKTVLERLEAIETELKEIKESRLKPT